MVSRIGTLFSLACHDADHDAFTVLGRKSAAAT
jgi:hypothetical protein